MNIEEIDIEKTFENGENILKLVKEYETELTNLNLRITNVVTETHEWQGSSAEKYSQLFLHDISEYKKALKVVESLANQLKVDATRYNNVAKKLKCQ